MYAFEEQRELPWTREGMFDLVADIERYPEFVPGWRSVRVLERAEGRLRVEQSIGPRLLGLRFRSRAALCRPASIEVRAEDGPLGALQLAWSFEPLAGSGCRVRLRVSADIRSRVVRAALDELHARTVPAFERRAAQLYGRP